MPDKPMSSQERASEIVKIFYPEKRRPENRARAGTTQKNLTTYIADAIREAEQEAYKRDRSDQVAIAVELMVALEGMIEIAKTAMPDTYFKTDSRVKAARSALAKAKRKSDASEEQN